MTKLLTVLLMVLAFGLSAARAQSIEDKAQLCASCHGASGVPLQKDMPVIWGQQLGYLFLQLRDFKTGAHQGLMLATSRMPARWNSPTSLRGSGNLLRFQVNT